MHNTGEARPRPCANPRSGWWYLFVLAQDRDRFSREPAYLYLLREELEEHSHALSPE